MAEESESRASGKGGDPLPINIFSRKQSSEGKTPLMEEVERIKAETLLNLPSISDSDSDSDAELVIVHSKPSIRVGGGAAEEEESPRVVTRASQAAVEVQSWVVL